MRVTKHGLLLLKLLADNGCTGPSIAAYIPSRPLGMTGARTPNNDHKIQSGYTVLLPVHSAAVWSPIIPLRNCGHVMAVHGCPLSQWCTHCCCRSCTEPTTYNYVIASRMYTSTLIPTSRWDHFQLFSQLKKYDIYYLFIY